jgi:thioredoxin-dependent peroxiredoxin
LAGGIMKPMAKRLQPGDKAPDFSTVTETGESVKLSDFRGKRVVLYFYPKNNTSGCTKQACGFRDRYQAIEDSNALVLGVSPDSAASHQRFKGKFNLPFPLLLDEDHQIAEAYGTWGEKSMYGKKYMGIVRSHFVIDEDGRIAEARYQVKPEESVESALGSLSRR